MKATGIEARRIARPRSAAIMIGRRRRRSTHAPANSPTMSAATCSTPRSAEMSSAPASRTRIAAHGSAVRVMSEPKIEIVAADQTVTKLRLLQSEADGDGSVIAGRVAVRQCAVPVWHDALMPARYSSERFVGRERELSHLAVALEAAADGRSPRLLVSGTGGTGVSRLVSEAVRRVGRLSEPFQVLRCTAVTARSRAAYGPIVEGFSPWLAALDDAELQRVAGPGA